MLQADSKEMFDAWIQAMQKGIGAAIQRIHSYNSDNEETKSSSGFQLYLPNSEDNRYSGKSVEQNSKVRKVR